jgi:hypothetical protein
MFDVDNICIEVLLYDNSSIHKLMSEAHISPLKPKFVLQIYKFT